MSASDVAAVPGIRYRLDLGYDGTAFSGWARQPGLRTVQGVLEDALEAIFRRTSPAPTLVVAGRTDAGVHASAQVAHLDLTAEQEAALLRPARGTRPAQTDAGAALLTRLNGILGLSSDVVVHRLTRAADGFDARFSALDRRYRYRIADRLSSRDPAQRHRTVWHQAELDLVSMQEAAGSLVGLNDFAAYCKPREGATTIRTLQDFRWHRDDDGVLVGDLVADAFCHSMVRGLVGACVAVGDGRLGARRPAELLNASARSSEFVVMPAKGLTLVAVGYPEDAHLAARIAQTRNRRGADEVPVRVGPTAL